VHLSPQARILDRRRVLQQATHTGLALDAFAEA
jgi:hypothetical protein